MTVIATTITAGGVMKSGVAMRLTNVSVSAAGMNGNAVSIGAMTIVMMIAATITITTIINTKIPA